MIRNERLKLLATALNNLALAYAIGGFVAPSIGGSLRIAVMLAWLAVATILHVAAQIALGRMRP